ncbi:hypothetical protein [Singulisphaera sp. PoT]|uniref:hypothetical protein n=1 Tax=Singulisphaera sp. PoT TaxID=3411797 RepID=UPI003BF4872E
MCSGCGELLSDWLAGGKDDPDALPAELDPAPDWPPLAGRSATPRDFAPGAAS